MKLISLNIEGDKHLDERVLPFMQAEQPDLVCMQEVFEADVPKLCQELEMEAYWAPMSNIVVPNPHLPAKGMLGVAQFTKWPVVDQRAEYYVGSREQIPYFFENRNPNAQNRVLVTQTVEIEDQRFTVATTHFTWSPEGSFTQEQASNFEALRNILKGFNKLVLCGDFNSPRNRDQENVYTTLAELYHDAIPPHYTTSIDSSLHKSGAQIELMVDGLFHTDHYQTSGVRLVDGVSDHMAIVATVATG